MECVCVNVCVCEVVADKVRGVDDCDALLDCDGVRERVLDAVTDPVDVIDTDSLAETDCVGDNEELLELVVEGVLDGLNDLVTLGV